MSIISQPQPEIIFDTEANKVAYGPLPDKTLVYVVETKIHWIYDADSSDYRILTTTSDIFVQVGNQTVANTASESSLLNSGTGSKTLPVGFLNIGRNINVKIKGYMSRYSGNATIRVKLDGTTILTTGAILVGSASNDAFEIDAVFTVRTTGITGSIVGQGKFTNWNNGNLLEMVSLGPIVIDTTIAQPVDVTIQWSNANAGNTITSTNATISI